eukprot:m.913303 g.913303  ORF g.913303 m.913303 type:complete len:59 (-) comp60127_c0_seq10:3583-3759(-)
MDCPNFIIRVDSTPYDAHFDCNCSTTGFSGLNCEIAPNDSCSSTTGYLSAFRVCARAP